MNLLGVNYFFLSSHLQSQSDCDLDSSRLKGAFRNYFEELKKINIKCSVPEGFLSCKDRPSGP